ncbi:hypothetical protein HNP84_005519 [Thermocatellispora tengchongensis]|uniref:GH64 domain-containing protein n=1 Tax=Thermocatellispora tengchongensis TaxID=1073253 RepID=A0A840PI71_9ACTN|nr:glycoside hydrolase family 64 protein [Thermocatellispora tengchongensis]MBB5135775.1 hypothetical protein [Thermocatellispora tengchongensis]
MTVRRRGFAAFAAGVVLALAACLPAAVPAAAVPATIPLVVKNDSGRSEPVYLYVLGSRAGTLGYADAAGGFHPWTGGTIPPSPAPDVAIPGPANGQSKTIQIPRLSGRIYFSFGQKIRFFLTPTGLVQPAPWNPSDPNRDILFDWSEYTLDDGGLWLNSSQVDMFSVPHAVGVKSASGAVRSTGRLVAGGRDRVLDALQNQPGGWAGLVHRRADGLRVRALAPGKGIDAGVFGANTLDSYITRSWDAYRNATLIVTPFADRPGTRFHGRTHGDTMVFTDASGATVASFAKPSSADAFNCAGRLFAPNDQVVGPIARTLCAGLNRSTLATIPTQPSTDPGRFYQDAVTNHYARVIHANMADGKAYAFPFDDVGGFESLVHDANPTTAYITLDPF